MPPPEVPAIRAHEYTDAEGRKHVVAASPVRRYTGGNALFLRAYAWAHRLDHPQFVSPSQALRLIRAATGAQAPASGSPRSPFYRAATAYLGAADARCALF